jgi:hypothetical protein
VGGIQLSVDGHEVDIPQTIAYHAAMLSGVPNLAFAFGFVNQSWTLGADLTCRRVCRLLNFMDQHGYDSVTPRRPEHLTEYAPFWELSSGYVRRGGRLWPQQGSSVPWYRPQSYPLARRSLTRSFADDPALEFGRLTAPARQAAEVAA